MKEKRRNTENEKILDKEIWRKITLRFLKDTGLYKKWVDYVAYLQIKRPESTEYVTSKNWFDKPFIDNIFGHTNFTAFIRKHSDFKVRGSVSDLFRIYLREMYGIENFKLYINSLPSTPIGYTEISKETGVAKLELIKKNVF